MNATKEEEEEDHNNNNNNNKMSTSHARSLKNVFLDIAVESPLGRRFRSPDTPYIWSSG